MDTQSEETPGVAMHRGSCLSEGAQRAQPGGSIIRVTVWFLQRSRFFMRQRTPKVNFSCMLQIYCNGGVFDEITSC
jgi:hypothetical protein